MINVTKPFLPPYDEVEKYLRQIWSRNWLTNNGPLVNELELKLKEYLGINHLLFVTNGTVALQLAIKALGLKGEVITTPFSYVATTSSIVWENCIPVFADIDKATLNIDPECIDKLVNENTSAILATHVYGNPCAIDEIQAIADKHGLKVIYDAAHCFGTRYRNKSIFEYGDISTASFHATKLYHSVEGGAVITKDAELLRKLSFLRNFGHNGPENFECVGINGKNSELHAAVGLVNLKYCDEILRRRKELFDYYCKKLDGLKVVRPGLNSLGCSNFSYFPIVFENEAALLKAVEFLTTNWIYPRRYFYPSLSQLNYVVKQSTPIADEISARVLCLPMYHDLSFEEIDFITRILLRAQNN